MRKSSSGTAWIDAEDKKYPDCDDIAGDVRDTLQQFVAQEYSAAERGARYSDEWTR